MSQKPTTISREKVTELYFRYQAKKSSGEGILFDFLKNDEVLSHKEMILQAIKVYWFPIAMAKTNFFSEDELSQAGLRAIQELRRQMQEIAFLTGVDWSAHFPGENPRKESHFSEFQEHLQVDSIPEESFSDLGC